MGLYISQDIGAFENIDLHLQSYSDTTAMFQVEDAEDVIRMWLSRDRITTLIQNLQTIKDAMPDA